MLHFYGRLYRNVLTLFSKYFDFNVEMYDFNLQMLDFFYVAVISASVVICSPNNKHSNTFILPQIAPIDLPTMSHYPKTRKGANKAIHPNSVRRSFK